MSGGTATEARTGESRQVLIVEDERVFARAVQKRLARTGFDSIIALDLASAYAAVKDKTFDLVLLDMRLPDGSGLDLLARLREQEDEAVPVLVMSAYGEIGDAVSAMKLGASDYLKKPVDLDELMMSVEKVMERDELSRKLVSSTVREKFAAEDVNFLGESPLIEDVRRQADQICALTRSAGTTPPVVLLLGETGTGKDVVARLLHNRSARSARPFVHVDCANLPRELVEAELFGHEKGAFTSAHVARMGLIEAAEDGVLFLDEIGELNLDIQAKFLAVLERHTVRRVGTTQERPVSAWFIAATNRDIARLTEDGEFRADLYYRLNVLSITLPPLRQTGEDIILLAEHFAGQTARRYGLGKPQLGAKVREILLNYPWPGNVRELKHVIERAVLLSSGGTIKADVLSLSPVPVAPGKMEKTDSGECATLQEAELKMLKDALARTGGNVSRAARDLGITRMAMRYRMKKHGLEK
ncbi:MAG: sigma-54 dependent transcriptional regulator [Gammaproteobacteria bacterium]